MSSEQIIEMARIYHRTIVSSLTDGGMTYKEMDQLWDDTSEDSKQEAIKAVKLIIVPLHAAISSQQKRIEELEAALKKLVAIAKEPLVLDSDVAENGRYLRSVVRSIAARLAVLDGKDS